MTPADYELLELAAKAAGFLNYTTYEGVVFVVTGASRGAAGYYWKPLTDCGDALRLAVKLKLQLTIGWDNPSLVTVQWIVENQDGTWFVRELESGQTQDIESETRRAIVRAAAEIGKAMP